MQTFDLFQVSEVEITYKTKVRPSDRPKVLSSRDAYDIFMKVWSDRIEFIEEFNILVMNKGNGVLGFSNISKGGVDATVVDLKIVFMTAMKLNGTAIILAHNHPSGTLRPSNADIELTNKLVAGGKILGLPILDHLIVTPFGYYSFADEGMLT